MTDTASSPPAPGAPHGSHPIARTLIGRGIAFPLIVDASGRFALTLGDDVHHSIRMIVMTAQGERVMRPEFGCEIWDHVFAPINAATLGQMAHAVRKALARWEPRIDVIQVRVRPRSLQPGSSVEEAAIVDIEIDYDLRLSNDRRNLVFPFYVIPESEGR